MRLRKDFIRMQDTISLISEFLWDGKSTIAIEEPSKDCSVTLGVPVRYMPGLYRKYSGAEISDSTRNQIKSEIVSFIRMGEAHDLFPRMESLNFEIEIDQMWGSIWILSGRKRSRIEDYLMELVYKHHIVNA